MTIINQINPMHKPNQTIALFGLGIIGTVSMMIPVQAQNANQINKIEAKTENRQCHKSSTEEIESLFQRWNQSLQTGKPEKVAANYANNAVLLATVSNHVLNSPREIREYFETFLKMKPYGKINEQNIRIYCDLAINSGIYTFNLTNHNQVNQVKARYTFVYRKIGDNWLIVEHHSSAIPEK